MKKKLLPGFLEGNWKFKFYAEYEDGETYYFYGNTEEDCICEIADATEEHGECTYYTGVNDEDRVDGEWVGRENFY